MLNKLLFSMNADVWTPDVRIEYCSGLTPYNGLCACNKARKSHFHACIDAPLRLYCCVVESVDTVNTDFH